MNKTPKELGFIMPAEWEAHSGIWFSWPYDLDSFPNPKKAQAACAQFIKAIKSGETVELQVLNKTAKQEVKKALSSLGANTNNINFHFADYTDGWMRDCGPTFVLNREKKKLAMVKWKFNAWGKAQDPHYAPLMKDAQLPYAMNKLLKMPMFEPDIILEGGSIEVNGQGTVMTTEQCLLNENRNPNLSKPQIEKYLKDNLGAAKIIWLKNGIEGDDTNGHIDDIARFVAPDSVVCAYEENKKDFNHAVLKENYKILQKSTTQDGKPLKIVKLPMPGSIYQGDLRLAASYANFYIGNSIVTVPTFKQPADKKALGIIQALFPNHKVVGIYAKDLICGGGTFHCMTQQQPMF